MYSRSSGVQLNLSDQLMRVVHVSPLVRLDRENPGIVTFFVENIPFYFKLTVLRAPWELGAQILTGGEYVMIFSIFRRGTLYATISPCYR